MSSSMRPFRRPRRHSMSRFHELSSTKSGRAEGGRHASESCQSSREADRGQGWTPWHTSFPSPSARRRRFALSQHGPPLHSLSHSIHNHLLGLHPAHFHPTPYAVQSWLLMDAPSMHAPSPLSTTYTPCTPETENVMERRSFLPLLASF